MKLKSDFWDYYDHEFDGKGIEFWRYSQKYGYSKQIQFVMLAAAGYTIPPIGRAIDLLNTYCDDKVWTQDFGYRIKHVVAYVDDMAHCGDGKKLWSDGNIYRTSAFMGGESLEKKRKAEETFCSAYVWKKHFYEEGVSFRHLQIGRHVFWLKYWSTEDWRSNCGDGGCELLNYSLYEGYNRKIKVPLFAIDFVEGKSGTLYAIDFNNAPGINKSGVERVLSPREVVAELEYAVHKFTLGPGAAVERKVYVNK